MIASGRAIPYDALVLTTGSVPRRLPGRIGGELGGVHVVRTLKDVDEMAPEIAEGRRALIVGGGYIGLEAAAVCRKKGLDVTLIEMAGSHPCARGLSRDLRVVPCLARRQGRDRAGRASA